MAKFGACLGLYNHFAIYSSGTVSTCCADFGALGQRVRNAQSEIGSPTKGYETDVLLYAHLLLAFVHPRVAPHDAQSMHCSVERATPAPPSIQPFPARLQTNHTSRTLELH